MNRYTPLLGIFTILVCTLVHPSHLSQRTTTLTPMAAAMLCSAAGDAAACKTEFWANGYDGTANTKNALEQLYQDAAKNPYLSLTPGQRYTDDTAMAYQTLIGLHYRHPRDAHKIMSSIAERYILDMADMQHGWAAPGRAAGIACKQAISTIKLRVQDPTTLWWRINRFNYADKQAITLLDQIKQGNGSGSVMRSHAFGIAYWTRPYMAAEYAAIHSEITHWHPRAIASCAAFAAGVAQSITYAQNNIDVDFNSIVTIMQRYAQQYQGPYCDVAALIHEAHESGKLFKARLQQASITTATQMINNPPTQTTMPLSRMPAGHISREAHDIRRDYMMTLANSQTGYHGWTADTALAAAVFIATIFPDDIESALYASVYTPGDSDTIATLVGALVGSRCHTKIPCMYANVEKAERLIWYADDTAEMTTFSLM